MVLELFVLAMGLALGYLLGSEILKDYYLAEVEELKNALRQENETAKALVKEISQNDETQIQMTDEQIQKARSLGWSWVLGLDPQK